MIMANKEAKKTYGILIPEFEIRGDHSKFINLSIVEIQDNGGIRNPSNYDGAEFQGLMFTALVDAHRSDGTSEVFGYGICYRDVYRAELHDVEIMYKTLKKVSRVRENFPFEPASFGQYVAMVAKGLGISKVVKAVDGQSVSSTYSDNQYRIWDMSFAASQVDHVCLHAIEQYRSENCIVA
jgi:hypothetical protein